MTDTGQDVVKHVNMSCKEPFAGMGYRCFTLYGKDYSEPLQLPISTVKELLTKITNVPCLTGLRILLDYGCPDNYGCSNNELTLKFDSVNLECDQEMHDLHSNLKRTAHEQIELCLERMRKGKCRYASFAQIFFPNAYTKGK